MTRKATTENPDGDVMEQGGTLFFKCNRPLSHVEYIDLRAKVEMEEERTGRRIIIVPHAVDVVKT